MKKTLSIKNISTLVTMDPERRELADAGLFIEDGFIRAVGASRDLPVAEETLDLSGYVVLPGFINTHHHLFQNLTRVFPDAQNCGLYGWLRRQYPVWSRITPEDIRESTTMGLAELALSGCTTASDHLYLFPNGVKLEDEIEAAKEVGLRFHASRGAMTLGESRGGLPPDSLVEDQDAVLRDMQRVIEAFHDPTPGSMLQIVVAPCAPFNVSADLMKESARLARAYGVRLHTHLAETSDEERFCIETFHCRPLEYAEKLGWAGHEVWYAHSVHMEEGEIARMANAGTGVAHCPSSNMRLAS